MDDTDEGFFTKIPKDERLIVVHAGGENGFVPNALLTFKQGIFLTILYKVN